MEINVGFYTWTNKKLVTIPLLPSQTQYEKRGFGKKVAATWKILCSICKNMSSQSQKKSQKKKSEISTSDETEEKKMR